MNQAVAIADAPRSRAERIHVTDPIPVLDSGRFEQMYRIAKVMATSSLLPDTLCSYYVEEKGDRIQKWLELDTVIANCFLIVNQAVGWNMDPFAVAQCASVVHGRVCYEGKLIAAVIDSRLGVRLSFEWNDQQGDAMGITVTGQIPGEATPRSIHGTVGMWKTTGKNSPWPKQPRAQLAYRGARDWARLHAPATMLGVYSDDELENAVQRQERRPPPPPSFTAPEPQPALEHRPPVPMPDLAKFDLTKVPADPVVTSGPGNGNGSSNGLRKPPAPSNGSPGPTPPGFDYAAHRARCVEELAGVTDFDSCQGVFVRFAQNPRDKLTDPQFQDLCDLVFARQGEFEPSR